MPRPTHAKTRAPLRGRVAVVAGATRGAGRGIARALGEAGATVYCTGRSVRGNPSPYKRPETIDETAEMITAAGGTAIEAGIQVVKSPADIGVERGKGPDRPVMAAWASTTWGASSSELTRASTATVEAISTRAPIRFPGIEYSALATCSVSSVEPLFTTMIFVTSEEGISRITFPMLRASLKAGIMT